MASKAERKKKGLAKHARNIAAQKRRANVRRAKKKRLHDQKPLPDPWPNTEGPTKEESAKAWEERFFWEDYYERNPDSTWAAPT